MEFHEIANIFPLLTEARLSALAEDIKTNGLAESLVTYEDKILDGRNRYLACEMAGVEPRFTKYIGNDPLAYVVSKNLVRRHLSESQRGVVAAKIETLKHGQRADYANRDANLHVSRTEAAKMLNVSERTVASGSTVISHGIPELIEAVDAGEIKVSVAAEIAKLPQEEQSNVVAIGEHEIMKKAAEIKLARRDAKREENKDKQKVVVPTPEGQYDVIVIDPPWPQFRIYRDVRPNQGEEHDYPTMSLEEIQALDIPAADDCHLWLWTTHKCLPDALRIIESWGFNYVNLNVWHKPGGFQPYGLPQYNCEFAIYAKKGSPQFVDTKNFFVCFSAPRGKHSEKPTEFYETIRRVTDGRRIDMFSRRAIMGFEGWGNESPVGEGQAVVG